MAVKRTVEAMGLNGRAAPAVASTSARLARPANLAGRVSNGRFPQVVETTATMLFRTTGVVVRSTAAAQVLLGTKEARLREGSPAAHVDRRNGGGTSNGVIGSRPLLLRPWSRC